MKLRFSIGIFFSLTLHLFLLAGLIRWYPGIIDSGDGSFSNWYSYSNKKKIESSSYDLEKINFNKKISVSEIIFPDIVLTSGQKKINTTNLTVKSKISLNSILSQVEKFPQRLNFEAISDKKLSGRVGELITILAPVKLEKQTSKKGLLKLNKRELRQFHESLEEFLSKRWEVPIHLRGSSNKVFVQLEIKKDGRLLNWEIKQSSNILLEKTLKKLLKSLQFLPSLPKSYLDDTYKFGIKFSPLNLK